MTPQQLALKDYQHRLAEAGISPGETSVEQEDELQRLVLEAWAS